MVSLAAGIICSVGVTVTHLPLKQEIAGSAPARSAYLFSYNKRVPFKDPEQRRQWCREVPRRRRAEWFAGKVCVTCGGRDNLELDHKDPATKISHRIWSWSANRRIAELAKCQPLCRECHAKKSVTEVLKGQERPDAKLTDNYVREIRASDESYRVLGARYNVAHSIIAKIKWGVDWKHIT